VVGVDGVFELISKRACSIFLIVLQDLIKMFPVIDWQQEFNILILFQEINPIRDGSTMNRLIILTVSLKRI
jgi:hypothetical protein